MRPGKRESQASHHCYPLLPLLSFHWIPCLVRDLSQPSTQSRNRKKISLGSIPQLCEFGEGRDRKEYTQGCLSSLYLLFPWGELFAALSVLWLWTGVGLAQCCRHVDCRTGSLPSLGNVERSQIGLLQQSSQIHPPTRGKKRTPPPSSTHPLTPASVHLPPWATSTPSPSSSQDSFGSPLYFSVSVSSVDLFFPLFLKFLRVEFRGMRSICSFAVPLGTSNKLAGFLLLCHSFHLILSNISPYCYIMVNLSMFFKLFILLLYRFLLDFLYSDKRVLTPWF